MTAPLLLSVTIALLIALEPAAAAKSHNSQNPAPSSAAHDVISSLAPAADAAAGTATARLTPRPAAPAAGTSVDSYALYFAFFFYIAVMVVVGGFVYMRWRRLRQTNLNASLYDVVVSVFAGSSRAAAQNGVYCGAPSVVHVSKGGVVLAQNTDSKRNMKRAANSVTRQQQQQQVHSGGFLDGLGRRFVGLLRGNTRVAFGVDSGEAGKDKCEDGPRTTAADIVEVRVNAHLLPPGAAVEKRERDPSGAAGNAGV